MKQIVDFIYNDIVLYAKGWYERSENICKDLDYLFSKIYGWTSPKENEVSHRMLIVLDKLYKAANATIEDCPRMWCMSHAYFEEEVRNRMYIYNNCSRDMAIILTVLSILQGLSVDDIKLNAPHYGKKEHFRMGSLGDKIPVSMTYTEMNRLAQKVFGVK